MINNKFFWFGYEDKEHLSYISNFYYDYLNENKIKTIKRIFIKLNNNNTTLETIDEINFLNLNEEENNINDFKTIKKNKKKCNNNNEKNEYLETTWNEDGIPIKFKKSTLDFYNNNYNNNKENIENNKISIIKFKNTFQESSYQKFKFIKTQNNIKKQLEIKKKEIENILNEIELLYQLIIDNDEKLDIYDEKDYEFVKKLELLKDDNKNLLELKKNILTEKKEFLEKLVFS
jgi:hypothetical protein